MAITGSTRTYKQGGAKWPWRRRVANQMIARMDGRERSGFWIYLAGPEDNDRDVLIDKGVPRRNLFAIDGRLANIKSLRSRRDYGVEAFIEDVIFAWPSDKPVSGLMLDFCSGLEARLTHKLIVALTNPAFHESVVMVNFMRGRDPSSNEMRRILEDEVGFAPDKHRARQFVRFLGWFMAGSALMRGDSRSELTLTQENERAMRPDYFSYESGVLRFDTAVFEPRWCGVPEDAWEKLKAREFEEDDAVFSQRRIALVRRRIAAQMALRTMNGRHSFPVH